jgi:hypothetical protein
MEYIFISFFEYMQINKKPRITNLQHPRVKIKTINIQKKKPSTFKSNEMKVLYILLNIYFPYYNSIISTYIGIGGYISISNFALLFSSPTNSIHGSISKCCILDTSYYGAKIASIFSCS